MDRHSLLQQGLYSLDWVQEFYDQTGVWWGPNTDYEIYQGRAATVERLCGAGPWRVLDLGCGPGGTAAALAAAGHAVVAVDLSETRVAFAQALAKTPRRGSLEVQEADFYTVQLEGRFDVVCCWEVFGLGCDADQRRLLRRIAQEWLTDNGKAIVDVYNPPRYVRLAGKTEQLAPLPGVPGSVAMIERSHFDPVQCRWIDEWEPVATPEAALAQTIRCYTPADLLLLLEGTGLRLVSAEVDGQVIDVYTPAVVLGGLLMEAWYYAAVLEKS